MPKLTDIDCRTLGAGEHTDGDGLEFVVKRSRKNGGKLLRNWVFRIQIDGKRRKFGLGSYPAVGLAKARQKRAIVVHALAEGIDPSVTAKRRAGLLEAQRTLTLAKAIDDWFAKAAPLS
jgi:hypothetical protein